MIEKYWITPPPASAVSGESECGFSLIELFVAVGIGLILVAASVRSLATMRELALKAEAQEQSRYVLQQADNAISRAFDRSRMLSSLETVKFFPDPHITNAFDQPLALGSSQTAAEALSSVIAYLELKRDIFLPVISAADPWSPQVCPVRLSTAEEIDNPFSFLALSVDGYADFQGTLKPLHRSSANCPQLYQVSDIRAGPGLFCHSTGESFTGDFSRQIMERAAQLLPINDEFAIYLDRAGALRRYSFITHSNQLISRHLKSVTARFQADQELLITLTTDDRVPLEQKQLQFLPKIGSLRFLELLP